MKRNLNSIRNSNLNMVSKSNLTRSSNATKNSNALEDRYKFKLFGTIFVKVTSIKEK